MTILPKVSILIPTYNRAHYVRQAIQSALAQTYTNIEVLVLDDCSSDETAQAVEEFATDQRVKYFRHKENLGIAGNWRFGIQVADGTYFCLLHDDDTFEPDCVGCLVQPLEENSDLILSACAHWLMNKEGQRLSVQTDENDCYFKRDKLRLGRIKTFAQSALLDLSIPIGATLFRRSMVAPEFIDFEAKGSIDIWLLYQCVRTGQGAYYVPARLMNYRAHEAGMSHSMPQYMLEGHLFRYRNMLTDVCMQPFRVIVQRQLVGTLFQLGVALLRYGKGNEARSLFKEAMQYAVSPKIVVAYCLSYGGEIGSRMAKAVSKS